jgi:hypothetical protein
LINETKVDRWFQLLWLCLTAWLIACALLVQGEYGDGYQTIVNARYLFGDSPNYFVQRGPLAAIALWPVEVFASAFSLDPLDVRPYHFLSALLHAAYLMGCWLLLRRAPGNDIARLIAFAAAILTVVFYSYAPFLSHDLLPGLLFLLFIFLCHRWLEKRDVKDAVYLVLLGAGVTLIKQTYAIFWIALMFYAVVAWLLKWDSSRVTVRRVVELGVFGLGSAVISYVAYAWFIGGELPNEAFLKRPLTLIDAISGQYGDDMAGMFATDLYLRNLHNYGIVAVLLVIPGVVMAWRGADARLRQIAVCWLIGVVCMQLIGFREARYLAFLAPLSAMLIVPVIQKLSTQKLPLAALLLVVLFDQSRGLVAASVPVRSAARVDVARFVNAPVGDGSMYASEVLSFAFSPSSPLARDRYHGIYHLTPLLLSGLYEGHVSVGSIADPRELGLSGIDVGDRVYYSNDTLLRRPPWNDQNQPAGLENFLLVAGDVVETELVFLQGAYRRPDNKNSYIMFLPDLDVGPMLPRINTGTLSLAAANELYGDVSQESHLTVLAVEIYALCQADSCSYR